MAAVDQEFPLLTSMPPPHHALTHACHHDSPTPLHRPTPERHPKRYLQRYPLRPTAPPSQITVAITAIRIHAMLYKAKRYLQRPTTPLSQITAIIIAIRIHAVLYKARRSPLPPPKALFPQTIHATIHTAAGLPRGHALVPHTFLPESQPTNPTRRSP
jgi:hypothetical protein